MTESETPNGAHRPTAPPKARRGTGQNRRSPASARREKRINISLTLEEHEVVQAAARRSGQTGATFIARVALAEARGVHDPLHAELRALLKELMCAGQQVRSLKSRFDTVLFPS